MFDAPGSAVIGVLLIVVALAVGEEVKSLLIGESTHPDREARMREHLEADPAVAELLNLIALQRGHDVMVAVKAGMAEAASARGLVEHINRCERARRKAFPEIRWLFFEPGVDD